MEREKSMARLAAHKQHFAAENMAIELKKAKYHEKRYSLSNKGNSKTMKTPPKKPSKNNKTKKI